MIIALAGRRIDAPDAEISRFPFENIELVRRRLRELFKKNEAKALVSSAACGADLIALDEADALGIRFRVVLPFARERFRETSVIDRRGNWGDLYDRLLERAEEGGDLVTLSGNASETNRYAAASRAILEEATALGWDLGHGTLAVLVWDGAPHGEEDSTKLFGDEAKRRGIPVVEIKTV